MTGINNKMHYINRIKRSSLEKINTNSHLFPSHYIVVVSSVNDIEKLLEYFFAFRNTLKRKQKQLKTVKKVYKRVQILKIF